MSPIFIPNSPVWGTLDVDTNGNLFVGGGDSGSQFFCVRSSNAQNPAVTPTFDQNVSVNLGGSLLFGAAINPGGLAGQIFLAVDRSGTATNNNIYMLATVEQFSASNGSDIMFSRSTDGGVMSQSCALYEKPPFRSLEKFSTRQSFAITKSVSEAMEIRES
jgi:hypothetical protein